MGEFVSSDTVWRMVRKLSKQMGIGNSKMPQRVKSPNYRLHLKLPMPGRRIAQRIPPIIKKLKFLKELTGLEPGWNSRQTPGKTLNKMESAICGAKVREELAKANVRFLFLAGFSASLNNAASGLRSWRRFCDTHN